MGVHVQGGRRVRVEGEGNCESIGSECDLMLKKICNYKLSKRANMQDYVQILDKYPKIVNEEIIIKKENIVLHPFQGWNKDSPSKLFWWTAYNKIKHNREENYKLGNFGNLLNILAALYFLEMYFCRGIGRKTNNIDVPYEKSKIFIINNWNINPTEKTIIIKEDIPETEKIDIELPYLVGKNELKVYYYNELLIKTTDDKKDLGNYIEVGEVGKMSHYIKTTGDWNLKKGDYLHIKVSR